MINKFIYILLLYFGDNKNKVMQSIKEYNFTTFYSFYKHDSTYIIIDSIIIRNKTGKTIQLLKVEENLNPISILYNPLSFEDYNFDGYIDISVTESGTGYNYSYYFWLYDHKSKLFKYNSALEKIVSPQFDIKNRKIISEYDSNYGTNIYTTYSWFNNRLVLEKEVTVLMVLENDVEYSITTTRKLVNGKMKIISKIKNRK